MNHFVILPRKLHSGVFYDTIRSSVKHCFARIVVTDILQFPSDLFRRQILLTPNSKARLARVVNLSELNASKMVRRLSAAVTFPLLPLISARILQAKGAGFLHLIKFFSYFFKKFFPIMQKGPDTDRCYQRSAVETFFQGCTTRYFTIPLYRHKFFLSIQKICRYSL